MAINFSDAKGTAKKGSGFELYTYKNGDNKVRIFGKILPRYVYWVPGSQGKNLPVECLSFDRDAEAFTNKEKDWVRVNYPDLKCQWAYSIMCIDEGKPKIMNLKKKLLQQIINTAEDLGDPTDPETGWTVAFKREKTGPLVYNVEYSLQPLKCKKVPLTDAEKAVIEKTPSIEELIPRPTPEDQKEFLDRIRADMEAGSDDLDENIEDEFDVA